jgi:hypothetical protein
VTVESISLGASQQLLSPLQLKHVWRKTLSTARLCWWMQRVMKLYWDCDVFVVLLSADREVTSRAAPLVRGPGPGRGFVAPATLETDSGRLDRIWPKAIEQRTFAWSPNASGVVLRRKLGQSHRRLANASLSSVCPSLQGAGGRALKPLKCPTYISWSAHSPSCQPARPIP